MSTFINIYDYEDVRFPFQFFVGGRGTGKTYSALRGIENRKIILMRRTADELDLLADVNGAETGNPFKTLNDNNGWNYGLSRINAKVLGIYDRILEDDKLIPIGAPVGLGVAMSTVSKVRGLDFSDYTDLIYDEFIPELHVKKMRSESDAFLNAYETINRNREFEGKPPLKVWGLANANNIYNPLFIGLGIVSEVEKMAKHGKEHCYIESRGIAIHLLKNTKDFSEKKEKTAIARLTKGTSFYDMAYNNEFSYNDFTNVNFRKLVGYVPLARFGKANLYHKKSTKEIYVSYAYANIPGYSDSNDADCIRFKREWGSILLDCYIHGNMYFESYELKEIVLHSIM